MNKLNFVLSIHYTKTFNAHMYWRKSRVVMLLGYLYDFLRHRIPLCDLLSVRQSLVVIKHVVELIPGQFLPNMICSIYMYRKNNLYKFYDPVFF